MATPAEEYIELQYRQTLVDNGDIEFFGGKQELIKLGFFDDVDIAMLTHTGSELPGTLGSTQVEQLTRAGLLILESIP